MTADLSGLNVVALMIDGVHFAGHCCVVALGIGIDGTMGSPLHDSGGSPGYPLRSRLGVFAVRSRGGTRMSTGLRAMMRLADETGALSFPVSMYCGSVFVSGHVAPRSWWSQVNKSAADEDRKKAMDQLGPKQRDRERRDGTIRKKYEEILSQMSSITEQDGGELDEVTLYDTWCSPAVGGTGAPTGRQHLPIARVPLASIDVWWIAGGHVFPGKGGGGLQFGVLVPLDF